MSAVVLHCAESNVPLQIVLDEPADNVVVERDQTSCVAEETFARERQIDARLASPQKRDAQLLLKTLHLHADRRLSAMERCRRARE